MAQSSGGRVVPDGGYGWVVVFCSFSIHVLSVGTYFALSVLYVSWLEEFGSSKANTSWIVSIGVAFLYGIGPIPAFIAGYLGYRVVCILGGVVGALGFALATLSQSVTMLTITVGVIGGTGLGFCYLPAIAMVALYFDKKRAMSLGIGTAGAGIGAFILAPLLSYLEHEYGWRGALLIHSGILLHLTILGMLLRPIPSAPDVDVEDVIEEDPIVEINVEEITGVPEIKEPLLNPKEDDIEMKMDVEHFPSSIQEEEGLLEENIVGKGNSLPQKDTNNDTRMSEVNNKGISLKRSYIEMPSSRRVMSHSVQHLPQRENGANKFSSAHELRPSGQLRHRKVSSKPFLYPKLSNRDISIGFWGSIHSLKFVDSKDNLKNIYTGPNQNRTTSESYVSLQEDSIYEQDLKGERQLPSSTPRRSWLMRHAISFVTFFSLLKDKVFLSLVVSNVLTNLSYLMPVVYMVDRAVEEGIDKRTASLLVSLNGIGNVVGRCLFAFLAGRPFADSLVIYILVLIICGVGTSLSPVSGSSLVLHGIYATFFGTFMGGYVSLAPVVTVDLMGADRVGQAYGILLFFMGASGSIGPPLAGFVYGITGDFSMAFILHGIFIALSAVVLLPVIINKHRHKCIKGK